MRKVPNSYELFFHRLGKSVGVVTNTRITHATPAASYAHTPERDWEADSDMEGISPECTDIAKQLIDDNPDINVSRS